MTAEKNRFHFKKSRNRWLYVMARNKVSKHMGPETQSRLFRKRSFDTNFIRI